MFAVIERGHHAAAAYANDAPAERTPSALIALAGRHCPVIGRDTQLQDWWIGLGFAHGLDVLRRTVDLGETAHEVDRLQPIDAGKVLLAGAAGQHDLASEVVDLRIRLDLLRLSAVNPAQALAVPVCSARMPPIRNIILVLGDQLSTRELAVVKPGLSTGSGGPAV